MGISKGRTYCRLTGPRGFCPSKGMNLVSSWLLPSYVSALSAATGSGFDLSYTSHELDCALLTREKRMAATRHLPHRPDHWE
jgi:hypothetical protein